MIYGQAHYAPGFGERYSRSDPRTTLTKAKQRVRNYSYPVFRLGHPPTSRRPMAMPMSSWRACWLARGMTYGWIFRQGRGFRAYALRNVPHPDTRGSACGSNAR